MSPYCLLRQTLTLKVQIVKVNGHKPKDYYNLTI